MPVHRLDTPPHASVAIPGSKSITNRALVCAALADGRSTISGALVSDDTEAMIDCLGVLGIPVTRKVSSARKEDAATGGTDGNATFEVLGCAGRPTAAGGAGPEPDRPPAVLDARLSGTTSRFIAPIGVLGPGSVLLDGSVPLRQRPMADLFDALKGLGAAVEPLGEPGRLPVHLDGGPTGLGGGRLRMRADVSSQFLSALLLAAPAMGSGLEVELEGPLVSRPYVAMTIAVMESFGAVVDSNDDLSRITVAGTGYVACEDFEVEPDASAASYFFALAAVTGGRVRVEGLGSDSLQGDLAFTDVLAAMGAEVECSSAFTEVRGTGALHGVELDMVDISDTSPTLAAIAPLADSPTTVTGIGFVRGKETDRISSVVTELRRIGIDAEELSDGFVVHPGAPNGAVVQTYDDHRMAMSFAILGLAAGNLSIADPGCVAKTFPGFWDTVARLGPTAS